MRFLHFADVHLGYQQYGSRERFDDFSRVYLHIVGQAITERVDFCLLAGDLFEKRTVDPLAMRVAIEGLRMLQDAGIPVIAVEGNHERAHYRDQYSWVDFLDALGYVRLLSPRFADGRAILEPHGDEGGAYVDLPLRPLRQGKPGGVRVYGLKYVGASTGKALAMMNEAFGRMDHANVSMTILMAHAGLEGQLPHTSGTLKYNDLSPLHEHVDYLALGHIHKPYEADGWVYNPGSPETCSMEEVAWPERGYYLVEVESSRKPAYRAELVVPPRRPFHRLRLPVDALEEPNAVYDAVRTLLRQKQNEITGDPEPVVGLTLSGVLAFNRFDLDLSYIEQIVEEMVSPLLVRLQNATMPAEFEVATDPEVSRAELEQGIVRELLERDARYRGAADDWARVALEVKRMALEKDSPDVLIDYLRRVRAELLAAEGA